MSPNSRVRLITMLIERTAEMEGPPTIAWQVRQVHPATVDAVIGCFPRMSEDEAWQAGRGVWKMNRSRAAAERFALVAGMGKVLAVAEVEGLTQHGDRFALEGHPLTAGHPLHDAYIGRADPLANQSQNFVTYGSLPEEGPLLIRPCGCGCGQETTRDFAQGHDMKAVQQRVREHFGGSVLALIRWIDSAHPRPAS